MLTLDPLGMCCFHSSFKLFPYNLVGNESNRFFHRNYSKPIRFNSKGEPRPSPGLLLLTPLPRTLRQMSQDSFLLFCRQKIIFPSLVMQEFNDLPQQRHASATQWRPLQQYKGFPGCKCEAAFNWKQVPLKSTYSINAFAARFQFQERHKNYTLCTSSTSSKT